MKTNPLLLSILLLITTQLFAQQIKQTNFRENHRLAGNHFAKAATQFLPQQTINYNWDSGNENWMESDQLKTTYNAGGEVLSELRVYYYNEGADSSLYKQNYVYNANNQQIESYGLNWNSNTQIWDTTSKSYTVYDVQGNETQSDNFSKFMDVWTRQYATKTILTYDVNNRVTEEIYQDWINHLNDYRNESKSIYTYNAQGEPSELTSMEWDTITSTFMNSEKYINVVWYKYNGNLDDGLLSSLTGQEWNGTSYVDALKITVTYDLHDNEINNKSESWDVTEWVLDNQSEYLHTYNGTDQLTQTIIRNRYNIDSAYTNSQKMVFSNFISYTNIQNQTADNQLGVTIYPNPLNSSSTINIEQNTLGTQFKLYDILGHEVYTTLLETPHTTIEKGDLQKGIYIYQILNENQSLAKGKLIIQ